MKCLKEFMNQRLNHNGNYKMFINDNKNYGMQLKQNLEEKLQP